MFFSFLGLDRMGMVRLLFFFIAGCSLLLVLPLSVTAIYRVSLEQTVNVRQATQLEDRQQSKNTLVLNPGIFFLHNSFQNAHQVCSPPAARQSLDPTAKTQRRVRPPYALP